jgi:ABC-2 type transport system permease protein
MNALVQAELLKLRTVRTNALLTSATLAIAALLGAATVATAGIDGAAPAGSAAGMVNVLTASSLAPLAGFILGVLASAGEYQHHTITQTYLTTPRRGRVLAAKAAALAVAGCALAAAITLAAMAGALPQLVAEGTSVALLDVDVVRAVGGNLLAGALFAVLGVAVGTVLRNQLAAVVGAAVWALLVEGVVATMAGEGTIRWFPGAAARALADGAPDLLPLPAAVGVTVAYAAGLCLLATRTVLRKDLT